MSKEEIIKHRGFNLAIASVVAITFLVFNFQFRTALLVGFILAVLSYPIAKFLENKLSKYFKKYAKSLSAIITIFFLTVVIITILNFVATQVAREIPRLSQIVVDAVNNLSTNEGFLEVIKNYGITPEFINSRVEELSKVTQSVRAGEGINFQYYLNEENINQALNIGQRALNLIFNQVVYLILFFLAWYNALVFGTKWLDSIFTILPFRKHEKNVVMRDLEVGVRNVIYANILSGLIHTVVSFIIMLVFGVENIFIISLIIFAIGFLPASPSELGYAIPISIIFTQNPVAAIVLAILAELLIIWVNYVFLPKIVLSGSEGNPLFVITSVMVGLQMFGLMGFIIGPVIMIFVNTLAQILLRRINNQDGHLQVQEMRADTII